MGDREKEVEAVYLCDGRFIEWDRPPRIQRPDRICMQDFLRVDASTKLISYIGFDALDERVGRYHLIASAAKYLASISLLGEEGFLFDKKQHPTNPSEEMVLFSGSLAIYSTGQIPGTEIEGHDFISHGEIFIAKTDFRDVLMSSQGLSSLIFENSREEEYKTRRVESIIRGYENQRLAEEDAKSRRVSEAYNLGSFDGQGHP